jgi:hypothetical protein
MNMGRRSGLRGSRSWGATPVGRFALAGLPGSVASALEDLIIEQVSMYRRPVEPGWLAYREDRP